MRQHKLSHAESPEGETLEIIEHPLVPSNTPKVITEQAEFNQLLDELRENKQFAYDTEFIGEHTFYPEFCVIQVGTQDKVTIIDPLAEINLIGFWELLADPAVEVLVHAGRQDLEPVYRYTGKPAANIFDTQIASAFCDYRYPISLTQLALEAIEADLGKGLKFSQWDHRPLTGAQIQYAANDVRYLPLLRELLGEQLDELSNLEHAKSACTQLSDINLYNFEPRSKKLKAKGLQTISQRQRMVVNHLMDWRGQLAIDVNQSIRMVLADQVLVDIASQSLSEPDQIKKMPGIPQWVKDQHAENITNAVATGLADKLPKYKPESTEHRDRLRTLTNQYYQVIENHCQAKKINPAVVASKKDLSKLINFVISHQKLPNDPIAQGWRHQIIGCVLDQIVQDLQTE